MKRMDIIQETLKSAISHNKFCKIMYEKLVKERAPNFELLLIYSSCLADEGKLSESLSTLCYIIQNFSCSVTNDKILPIVSRIIENLRQDSSVCDIIIHKDPLSCPSCCGVLNDPVTLLCGHTYCKSCLIKAQKKVCYVCQTKIRSSDLSNLRVNVLITSLVEKWFRRESKGVLLRNKANKYFKEKQFLKAVHTYSEAVKYAPNDHLLLSNRSHAFYALGNYEAALKDGDEVVKLCPAWGKGHYRRANALFALGKTEEALEELLICAVLETTSDESLSVEITKVLLRVMRQNTQKMPSEILSKHYAQFESTVRQTEIEGGNKSSKSDKSSCKKPFTSAVPAPHLIPEEISAITSILNKFSADIMKIKNSSSPKRTVNPTDVQKSDFECSLCYHYLWEPVTTPCGHTFCRSCLDRSLDHAVHCPLCKMSLREVLAENQSSINEFVEHAMKTLIPDEYKERGLQYEHEMNEYAKAGKDLHHEIPIFVATLAIPSIACPLHVFEPRYRLMIRRVMEAGTREFGMCMPSPSQENGYSNYGTMLEVREVKPIHDGRRIVNAVGSRRFRCISKGVKDGYNTASVEYLKDEEVCEDDLPSIKQLHNSVYKRANDWFYSLDGETRRRITSHYGVMPSFEDQYWTLTNGPVWIWWLIAVLPLEPSIQMRILKETSLQSRLNLVSQILRCVLLHQNRSQ